MQRWPYFIAIGTLLGTLGFLQNLSHGEILIPKRVFAEFPLHLATRWQGKDLDISQDVLDVLKVSDYLMRYYEPIPPASDVPPEEKLSSVTLYVGFYQSQRSGATYHSPKNCLPGSGWNFVETTSTTLPIQAPYPQQASIQINKVLIQKGLSQQLVLYWYHDRGRIIASEYMAKAYMVWDAMTANRTDGALVRIIIPVQTTPEDAFRVGSTFIQDMWPNLLQHMPESLSI